MLCARIIRTFSSRIAGLWWSHTALAVVDCVLMPALSLLVAPGIGLTFLMSTGLFQEAGRARA